jgi:N-acetylneuraminate lyase
VTRAATEGAQPHGPLQGVLAAALTPLCRDGEAIDENAIADLVEFYADAGLDGVMVAGTTGEGLLLSRSERERIGEGFLQASNGRLPITVHAGSMTTAETVALAGHAAASGAVAVAVCAPPFFRLDEASLLAHFQAAADASAPVPFYLYEIQPLTSYPIPVGVVERLRQTAPNLVGMKVSDSTFEELERYLLPGFDILVGAESLLKAGLTAGAVGAISGVAAALPQHVVRGLRDPGDRGSSIGPLRAGLERYPFQSAAKLALVAQNLPLEACVRAPLRALTPAERTELDDWLAGVLVTRSEVAAP